MFKILIATQLENHCKHLLVTENTTVNKRNWNKKNRCCKNFCIQCCQTCFRNGPNYNFKTVVLYDARYEYAKLI